MKIILRLAAQDGSTAFFVSAIILPLIFFVFTLSLDLNKYFYERDQLQKAVDQAASYAYRFLPHQQKAQAAAFARLSSSEVVTNTQLKENTKVTAGRDGIRVELSSLSQLIFAKYFAIDGGIPINVSASARGPAIDLYLALDFSSYMAPDPLADTLWGYPEDWPAAQYFMFDRLFYHNGEIISPQLITEQCFNPSLSELKLSAIELFEHFSSFSSSLIGLGFYPGVTGAVDIARPLSSPGRLAQDTGEAAFLNYQGQYQADQFCLDAAKTEQIHSAFSIPQIQVLGSGYQPTTIEEFAAREIIWSKSVLYNRQADSVSALSELTGLLIAGGRSTSRGSLVNASQKLAVMLSGDLPRIGPMRFPDPQVKSALAAEFQKLRLSAHANSSRISIYFVVIPTPGIEVDLTEAVEFFNEQSSDDKLEVKLLSGDSASIVGAIMLDKQTAVITE